MRGLKTLQSPLKSERSKLSAAGLDYAAIFVIINVPQEAKLDFIFSCRRHPQPFWSKLDQ